MILNTRRDKKKKQTKRLFFFTTQSCIILGFAKRRTKFHIFKWNLNKVEKHEIKCQSDLQQMYDILIASNNIRLVDAHKFPPSKNDAFSMNANLCYKNPLGFLPANIFLHINIFLCLFPNTHLSFQEEKKKSGCMHLVKCRYPKKKQQQKKNNNQPHHLTTFHFIHERKRLRKKNVMHTYQFNA